jgi:hypothetical protein
MARKVTNFGVLMKDGSEGTSFAVDMEKLPSDDPLAYAHGFVTAMRGNGMSEEVPKEDLAKAYIDGWYHGQRVFAEEEEMPTWVNKVV